MANGQSCLDINEEKLKEYGQIAKSLLNSVKWIPKDDKPKAVATGYLQAAAPSSPSAQDIKLAELIRAFGNADSDFPSDSAHNILSALRQGIRIGGYVSAQFARSSGMEQLAKANGTNELPLTKQAEFRSKIMSTAAIRIFVFAYYVAWKLSRYESEKLVSSTITCPSLPEINLMNPDKAMNCSLYYLGRFLGDGTMVRTELDLVKATIVYCETLMGELQKLKDSLEFTDTFTGVNYKLQNEDFVISGFTSNLSAQDSPIECSRVEARDIIGNEIAKHAVRRQIEFMMAYNPKTRRNIFFDLRLMSKMRLFFGTTGTGKTQTARYSITYLLDVCKALGRQVNVLEVPNVISKMQGETSINMHNFWRKFFNPEILTYGYSDDADSKFLSRTNATASEGSKQSVEATLSETDGVKSTWCGGGYFDYFTNNPDLLDTAILSRTDEKVPVNGAQRYEDFMDFDHLREEAIRAIDPNFIQMTDPAGYVYLAAQQQLTSLSQAYGDYREPKEPAIKEVYERVLEQHDPSTQEFFGQFYLGVQKRFPLFNLRDLNNISTAIGRRLGDIDLPKEWLENPELFCDKPYEEQKPIVLELMQGNMRGLKYWEIRLQEAIRYLDAMAQISERVKRREIEEMAESIRRRNAAIELVNAPAI